MYYEKEAISKQLYEWLLKNNYADANLIAKWKKQGYEKVCIPFSNGPSGARLMITALLSPLHSDQRNKLQLYLYLPRSQGPAERGADDSVR